MGRRKGEQERENVQKINKLQTCYLELYSFIDALSLERNKEKISMLTANLKLTVIP